MKSAFFSGMTPMAVNSLFPINIAILFPHVLVISLKEAYFVFVSKNYRLVPRVYRNHKRPNLTGKKVLVIKVVNIS